MKTSNTIQNFLKENNPDKLKELLGLFNPSEPEIIAQYIGLQSKFNESSNFTNKGQFQNLNNIKINQNLNAIIKNEGINSFVLHKISDDLKILYQGYSSNNECCGELHFLKNKLFLASFAYPRLVNGGRMEFIKNNFGIDSNSFLINEFVHLRNEFSDIILIENGAVLKLHYFNKDTLESLHQ